MTQRSRLTHLRNRCGLGSHKWAPVERAGQLGCDRQRRNAKCDEHVAGVSDPRARGCDACGSRSQGRVRRRRRRSTRDLVLTVPDGRGSSAVAWEHVLEPIPNGRTRLIVRGRASSRWLDLARATPPTGHRRIFVERAYAVLATLPRPLLIACAQLGHRIMEARHLRGIQRRSTAASAPRETSGEGWRKALLASGIASSLLYAVMIWQFDTRATAPCRRSRAN